MQVHRRADCVCGYRHHLPLLQDEWRQAFVSRYQVYRPSKGSDQARPCFLAVGCTRIVPCIRVMYQDT